MDFSSLKGLTIPEGVVTKITDAVGNVLWSAVKKVKVTITLACGSISGGRASIHVNSKEPFVYNPTGSNPSLVTNYSYVVGYEADGTFTIELLTESTIECEVMDTKSAENRCYVKLNGVEVLGETGTYVYTVTKDAAIRVEDKYAMGEYGMITITDSTENLKSFTVNGKSYAFWSGQTWADWLGSESDDGFLTSNGYLVYISGTYGWDDEGGFEYADCLYYPDNSYTLVTCTDVIQPIDYVAQATTM